MSDDSRPFVSLDALRRRPPHPDQALGQIRTIYFKTTRRTIHHDLAAAIEILKSLPAEEDRERARVYMDGLSQLRSEWAAKPRTPGRTRGAGRAPRPK